MLSETDRRGGHMNSPLALYCDGGVVQRNPSRICGTWAWCAVDTNERRTATASGVIPAAPDGTVTSNLAEFVAAIFALESVPDGWAGVLYTDSEITRGRLVDGWALRGLPLEWVTRGGAVLQRLTRDEQRTFRVVLLQGHPTAAELRRGVGRSGRPVSEHNCWCDAECTRQGRAYAAGVGQ